MWQVLGAVIQIVLLILKNKFEKDADRKKKNEELHKDAVVAIKNRDASSLNAVLNKLHNS